MYIEVIKDKKQNRSKVFFLTWNINFQFPFGSSNLHQVVLRFDNS